MYITKNNIEMSKINTNVILNICTSNTFEWQVDKLAVLSVELIRIYMTHVCSVANLNFLYYNYMYLSFYCNILLCIIKYRQHALFYLPVTGV